MQKDVEIVNNQTNPPIELKAARMACEWEYLFAAELNRAAVEFAQGAGVITAAHYQGALPQVVTRILDIINVQSTESHAQPRAA